MIERWLAHLWAKPPAPSEQASLISDFAATFRSPSGQRVLQLLVDNFYATVAPSANRDAALELNGRRYVVHQILTYIDMAENPQKYLASQKENQDPRFFRGLDPR